MSAARPRQNPARLGQAAALLTAGRVDLAEKVLRDVLADQPDAAEAHRLLSICLRRRGQPIGARDEALEAIRLAPRLAMGHHALGATLQELHRYADAEKSYVEALRLSPRLALLHASYSGLLRDMGLLDRSIEEARAGLAINPADIDCLTQLGLTLIRAHRIEEAHQVFRDALSDSPTLAHLHNNIGITLLRQGEHQAAAVEFREALRLEPGMEAAQNNLRNLSRHRKSWPPDPYATRLRFRWRRLPLLARAAAIGLLAAAGFSWPGFWGADAWLVALEARRLMEIRDPGKGPNTFLWTRFLILLILSIPLTGPSPTVSEITDVRPTWPPALASLIDLHDLPPIDTTPIAIQTTIYPPTYMLAVLQLVAGFALMGLVLPLLVCRERVTRLVAAGVAAAGIALAAWTARPGTVTTDVWPVAILALVAGTYVAGRLVYAVELARTGSVFETERL